MPYGKHKGRPLAKVHADYLRWMVQVEHQYAGRARRELKSRKPKRRRMRAGRARS